MKLWKLEQRFKLRGKAIGVEQVLHAQRAASDLVFVRGADAAPRRADLFIAHRRFPRLVECYVDRQHERARRRDLEP
jgi:hypothetical protein